MHQLTKRLEEGQDLRIEIERMVNDHNIKAGVVVSVVGSLSSLVLRMAGAQEVKEWKGEFEIVSMTGTLSQSGCHIHMSASDNNGLVIGGHLKEGCIVRTTVELVLLSFDHISYRRVPDPRTGYDELKTE